MIIYLDILFIYETIINFIIIYLTSKISSKKTSLKRILLSSMIGTIFTIFCLLFSIESNSALKIICATIMINIAFKYENIFNYMSTIVLFYTITFLIGGIFLYTKINELNSIIFCVLSSLLLLYIFKEYKQKYQIQNYIVDIQLSDTSEKIKALIDTGHNLKTCYEESVIVLSKRIKKNADKLKQKSDIERIISYKTIQQESIITTGTKILNVKLNYKNKEYVNDVVIIFSDVNFEGYDAIIGLSFFEHAKKQCNEKKIKREREKRNGDIIFNKNKNRENNFKNFNLFRN